MQVNIPTEATQDPKPLTHWFHMFASIVDNNELAKMGTQAFAVYCVVKRHAGFNNGDSFPSIETIAERTGLSARQVMRELDTLIGLNYIGKQKIGRRNLYEITEKIAITTETGDQGVATFKYAPALAQECVRELKSLIASGEKTGKHVKISIENITVNVQIVNDHSVQINNMNVDAKSVSETEIAKMKAALEKTTVCVDN